MRDGEAPTAATADASPSGESAARHAALREVEPGSARDLAIVARLHAALLDFGPLTALGERFLRRVCYADPMRDGLMRVVLYEVKGCPAGFLAYTGRSTSLHRSVLRNHRWAALWHALFAVLSDPRRLLCLGRAVKVILSRTSDAVVEQDPPGELLALAVLPEYLTPAFVKSTGRRVADELVAHARQYCQRAGVRRLRAFVDADDKKTLLLYGGLGARFEPRVQAGEHFVEVHLDLGSGGDGVPGGFPACWSQDPEPEGPARGQGGAAAWDLYWEGLSQRRIFRFEARDFVRRLEQAIPLHPEDRVLDFGCGFGWVADSLAPKVGEVYLWDAAANMRRRARLNVANHSNIRFLDLSDPDVDPGVRFDLVIVNSVLQYMTREEVCSHLRRWRDMMNPHGRVVLSDLIPHDHSGVLEMVALLRFTARNGFLLRSIWDGLSEVKRYARTRVARPLLRVGREELIGWARASGFNVLFLLGSMTHHAQRTTAILSLSARHPSRQC